MLKKLLVIIILLVSSTALSCPSLQELNLRLKHFGSGNLQAISVVPSKVRGFCKVIMNDGEVFLTDERGSYLLKGMIFRLPPVKLSKEEIQFLKSQASFTLGRGKRELIVVADPECPSCKKGAKKLRELERKYRIYIVLAPFHGEKSFKESATLICKKLPIRYFFKNLRSYEVCDTAKLKLWTTLDFLKKLGINTTPVFITQNGKVFYGLNFLR